MVYIPPNGQLRHYLVNALHDSPITSHSGQWKTTDLVAHNFWWLGMGRYIAKYTKGCDLCNRTKNYPSAPAGKLIPNRIPDHRWQTILVDLITELPWSHGYDAIMVVVDRLSKHAHAILTTSDVTASGIARLFRDHVWKLYGLPEEVISDQGTQFVSNFTCSLSQLLKIRIAASTAYHLQTNGQTERVNQEVEQFLQLFVNQCQDNWDEWLSIAEFAYNNRVHTSMHSSPFILDTGQHPRLGVEPLRESRLETLNHFASRMEKATEEVCSALTRAADDMAQFYDAHRREAPLYEVGDKVWLNGHNITMTRLTKKLDHKWLGPYPIKKVISWSTYQLKLPSLFSQTHPVFSVTLLRPYNVDTIVEQVQHDPPPPPVIKDGVKEYEVERILDSRLFRGKLEYLVHWKGYGVEEDEWRPVEDVKGSRQLISKFHHWNSEAPQHISTLNFSNLPFHPLSNFTDTPDTVPSGWAMGHCTSGCHTFEGGGKCQGLFNLTHTFCPTRFHHPNLGNHQPIRLEVISSG